MDTLNGTSWDVVLAGTGLQSSLLALALSRSNKKILHLDSNTSYGGREAALSITELEAWADATNAPDNVSAFGNVSVATPSVVTDGSAKLSSARAYSLSLSPCLLFTRSALLPALVSSKAHEQLEFLAVGSWYVYHEATSAGSSGGQLVKVPNNREAIFADQTLSLRAKGALVRFLRFVAHHQDQEHEETWAAWKDKPLADFLVTKFGIPSTYHGPLLALSMSSSPSEEVKTHLAVASIHRHMTSMGVFGAGFSAILPKYGGLSEVNQVACRAAAVGGAVYVLNRRIEHITSLDDSKLLQIELQGGDKIVAGRLVGTQDQLRTPDLRTKSGEQSEDVVHSRRISVVGSRLSCLFPPNSEGSPPPSAAVVVFPGDSPMGKPGHELTDTHPIHLFVHSSDTGECPPGQCIVYAMTAQSLDGAAARLEQAVHRLLDATGEEPPPQDLWSIQYEVRSSVDGPAVLHDQSNAAMSYFVESPTGPVFDDRIIESVQEAWFSITQEPKESFMVFPDRNTQTDGDEMAVSTDDSA